jgi:hypothetical protein
MSPLATASDEMIREFEKTLREAEALGITKYELPVQPIQNATLSRLPCGLTKYDIDGADTSPAGIAQTANPAVVPPDNLPVRFLRLEKPVSIPDDEVRDFDNTAFGPSRAQSMREILGYVPVEPDGSVRVAVPANVAFAISVVDDGGAADRSTPPELAERHAGGNPLVQGLP